MSNTYRNQLAHITYIGTKKNYICVAVTYTVNVMFTYTAITYSY